MKKDNLLTLTEKAVKLSEKHKVTFSYAKSILVKMDGNLLEADCFFRDMEDVSKGEYFHD